MSVSVHRVAKEGFGEGTNELYDRARPSYPPSALAAIKSALNPSAPVKVLELGAGTGIFTKAFLAHPEWSSALRELRAIEPSEGMRARFASTVDDHRVTVQDGTFQNTHVPDGWADLIVIAQAFHWCPDYDKAMAEFNRALSPTGRVVFIWNMEGRLTYSSTAWVGQLRHVIEAFEQGTPQFRLGLWRQTFDTPSYMSSFEAPEENTFRHSVMGTFQGVIDRAFTKSYIAIASEEDKDQIRAQLTEIVKRGDDKVWINEEAGTFEYPYVTTLIIMKKGTSSVRHAI
ncbi:S-adenosyl-L-methionine-dependent methyltransferase [Hysterangium stoloniferum]|nr:S-adenosyl-L-methionine-dependent methyltransferase [Hysterangium stoloniferum]